MRRLAETADLTFHGVPLFTPAMDETTPIHVAVMGMMAPVAPKSSWERTTVIEDGPG